MTHKTDEEIKTLINQVCQKQRTRETITRWRNGTRSPNFQEVKEIERELHLPFETLLRNANLEAIKKELEEQLKAVKKMEKEGSR